jgi:hypothetical protein
MAEFLSIFGSNLHNEPCCADFGSVFGQQKKQAPIGLPQSTYDLRKAFVA